MFLQMLHQGLHRGSISVRFDTGEQHQFGEGSPHATWLLKNLKVAEKIARNYSYQLGESYLNGDWTVPRGELPRLLGILHDNFATRPPPRVLLSLAKLLQQFNHIAASYRNVAEHYDLDQALFATFLDQDMHYSCAYFEHEGQSLEQAQQAKCRHIAAKLLPANGQRVLDIGCGWGSFARYLAQHHEVEVVGITLSSEQCCFAQERASALKLDNVQFKLEDYREHAGSYDRIVSIGMFEHVGKPYYQAFFEHVQRLLKPEGVALVHSIGRSTPPATTNPWIRRHIFPGGAIPALSEMAAAAERSRLIQTDIEVLRLHYALTLEAWYQRFQQRRAMLVTRMGERFCRMWEFYLAVSELSFRRGELLVYQQQLTRQHGVVPITRDYLYRGSAAEETPMPYLAENEPLRHASKLSMEHNRATGFSR